MSQRSRSWCVPRKDGVEGGVSCPVSPLWVRFYWVQWDLCLPLLCKQHLALAVSAMGFPLTRYARALLPPCLCSTAGFSTAITTLWVSLLKFIYCNCQLWIRAGHQSSCWPLWSKAPCPGGWTMPAVPQGCGFTPSCSHSLCGTRNPNIYSYRQNLSVDACQIPHLQNTSEPLVSSRSWTGFPSLPPLPNLTPERHMMEMPSHTWLIAMHIAVKISFSFQEQKVCQLV